MRTLPKIARGRVGASLPTAALPHWEIPRARRRRGISAHRRLRSFPSALHAHTEQASSIATHASRKMLHNTNNDILASSLQLHRHTFPKCPPPLPNGPLARSHLALGTWRPSTVPASVLSFPPTLPHSGIYMCPAFSLTATHRPSSVMPLPLASYTAKPPGPTHVAR